MLGKRGEKMRAIDKYREDHPDDLRDDECIYRQCCVCFYGYKVDENDSKNCTKDSCEECWESEIIEDCVKEDNNNCVWVKCVRPVSFLSEEKGEISFETGRYYKTALFSDEVEIFFTPIFPISIKIKYRVFKTFFETEIGYSQKEKRFFQCLYKMTLKNTDYGCVSFKESMVYKAEVTGINTVVYLYIDSEKERVTLPTDFFLERFKLVDGEEEGVEAEK